MDQWLLPIPDPHNWVDIPDYEEALVRGLTENVKFGDRVVVVGAGCGVTTVISARAAGKLGRVMCFEASSACLSWSKATYRMNRRSFLAPARFVHGVVGAQKVVLSDEADGRNVRPEILPECDVLELDCEGSELLILRDMMIRPRAVVVETHGAFGAPTREVCDVLAGRGYEVIDIRLAEERFHDLHVALDVRVVVAVRRIE